MRIGVNLHSVHTAVTHIHTTIVRYQHTFEKWTRLDKQTVLTSATRTMLQVDQVAPLLMVEPAPGRT
ncbi:hypothetical protein CBL_09699 [Carabus blaptoides fortunei]